METILGWQIAIALSILFARFFSSGTMIMVALGWSAFTFLALSASWLISVQLATVWGVVWALSSIFRTPDTTESRAGKDKSVPVAEPDEDEEVEEQPAGPARRAHPVQPANKPARAEVFDFKDETTRAGDENPRSIGASIGHALDELESFLQVQLERQKANSALRSDLRLLRRSVEIAFEMGERERKVDALNAADPVRAKIYTETMNELRKLIPDRDPDAKTQLYDVLEPPVHAAALSEPAAEERRQIIGDTLAFLEQVREQLEKDPELQVTMDKNLIRPILPFITSRHELLLGHLFLLGPGNEISARHGSEETGAPEPDEPHKRASVNQDATAKKPTEGFNFVTPVTVSASAAGKTGQTDLHPHEGLTEEPVTGEKSSIEKYALSLGIPHLVHFTRCENLPGILEHGLMSVATCNKKRLNPVRNDQYRYDGQLDALSLSVAFPNYLMFYKYRQLLPQADWAVLLIAPCALWQKDCAFYAHNAADARMFRQARDSRKTAQALREMFSDETSDRDSVLRAFDPTDPQAEVLVYDTIEPALIEAVAFETRQVRERYQPVLAGLESFYAGAGAGLFASRRQTRAH